MGELIRRILEMAEERGMSLNALGEAAGFKRGMIYKIVGGTRGSMDIVTLLALAQALDVTTDWLLTGKGPRQWPAKSHAPTAVEEKAEKLRVAVTPRRRLRDVVDE